MWTLGMRSSRERAGLSSWSSRVSGTFSPEAVCVWEVATYFSMPGRSSRGTPSSRIWGIRLLERKEDEKKK